MAARTTAATSTCLSESLEARLKEIAIEDIDVVMNATRWGDKPYRRGRRR
jgi:hypothetical protein